MFQSVISLIPLTMRIVFTVLFILAFDLYAYQAVRTLTSDLSVQVRRFFRIGFWVVGIFFYFMALLAMGGYFVHAPRSLFVFVTGLFFAMFVAKILMVIPLLAEDLYRLLRAGYELIKLLINKSDSPEIKGILVSRKNFLSGISAGLGALAFSGLGYGIVRGAHHYKIHRSRIPLSRLPDGFKGMKIGHLSDIHAGSFWDKKAVERGINMLMREKPDVIFFTGDLVNSLADEMNEDYIRLFSQLNAPLGVYSILGNHDYGDYHQWPDRKTGTDNGNHAQRDKSHMSPLQLANLEKLKGIHKRMGWDLLMNENRILEKDGSRMALIGVENYGARGRFARYGKLEKAVKGTEELPFKILLSHDPSHWDAEVRKNFPDIDVTFSGHTHGAQFGIETAGFRWSPVQFMYKQWAGLYESEKQFLYVNRGFGYLGYPGRLGIRPEIAIITLDV